MHQGCKILPIHSLVLGVEFFILLCIAQVLLLLLLLLLLLVRLGLAGCLSICLSVCLSLWHHHVLVQCLFQFDAVRWTLEGEQEASAPHMLDGTNLMAPPPLPWASNAGAVSCTPLLGLSAPDGWLAGLTQPGPSSPCPVPEAATQLTPPHDVRCKTLIHVDSSFVHIHLMGVGSSKTGRVLPHHWRGVNEASHGFMKWYGLIRIDMDCVSIISCLWVLFSYDSRGLISF